MVSDKIFMGISEMLDTILEGDHPRTISAKLGGDWLSSFREDFLKISSPFFLFLAWWTSWLEVGIIGHIFWRGPSKDHSTKVWFQLAQWFLKGRLLCEFPIEFYVKLSSAVGAILVEGPNRLTHFWNHPMTISSTLSFYWANGFRQEDFYGDFP